MAEIANNLTPLMTTLIPEHNRTTIKQFFKWIRTGIQFLSEWGPVKCRTTWTWEKSFAAMKISFDVNKM
jgi:hypothetical protein